MLPGKIWVAEHDGVHLIRMVGDVRLTLCVSFDDYIASMFTGDSLDSIVFDLTHAEAVDSTTLGLMAKISILAKDHNGIVPVIMCASQGIRRVLESMGFDEIFQIVNAKAQDYSQGTCLPTIETDEGTVKDKVLEAHRTLMCLNETNSETFKDLVKTLEDC